LDTRVRLGLYSSISIGGGVGGETERERERARERDREKCKEYLWLAMLVSPQEELVSARTHSVALVVIFLIAC
jgi:hypothetical protein